jgi:ubiquinone/menaquinone biosynthesis C-methylase UbiE
MSSSVIADLQGPAGNSRDKYTAADPLSRLLWRRFLAALEQEVDAATPTGILDVGCGEGLGTRRLKARHPAARVVGLDVADPTLQAWWRRADSGVQFVTGSAYRLPYDDNTFDLVCAIELLEHLDHPQQALREMRRVARHNLIISVPWEPVWRCANLLALRYLRDAGNTPGHVNHWTRRGITSLLASTGTVVSVRRPLPWTIVRVALPA